MSDIDRDLAAINSGIKIHGWVVFTQIWSYFEGLKQVAEIVVFSAI